MKTALTILAFASVLAACQSETIEKSSTTTTPTETMSVSTAFDTTGQTLLVKGTFENAVHTTSGVARVYEDKNKKRTLVLENFKTDAGPDLRIYLAEDKSVTNFVQVTGKVQNGNSAIAIPSNANLQTQAYVLIWCRQFAVLFGAAKLK